MNFLKIRENTTPRGDGNAPLSNITSNTLLLK